MNKKRPISEYALMREDLRRRIVYAEQNGHPFIPVKKDEVRLLFCQDETLTITAWNFSNAEALWSQGFIAYYLSWPVQLIND